MPATRLQTQQKVLRKTRGLRNQRVGVQVSYRDPLSFDLIGLKSTESSRKGGETMSHPKTVITTTGPKESKSDMTCARARPYKRLRDNKGSDNRVTSSQESAEVQIIDKNPCQNTKLPSKKRRKYRWITHAGRNSPSASTVQPEKSSQDSESSSTLSDETCKDALKQLPVPETKTVVDVAKIPRYLLNPEEFIDDPVEKERIKKSIYDRQRREKEMKTKYGQLKQENMNLKRMLFMSMGKAGDQSSGQDGKSMKLPTSCTPPVLSTVSIINKGIPVRAYKSGLISYPKPNPQVEQKSLPTTENVKLEKLHPVSMLILKKKKLPKTSISKRQRKETQPRSLEEENKLIYELYKQFDNEDDDEQSILAAIQGMTQTMAEHSDADKSNKRKIADTVAMGNMCDDEIQVLEVVKSTKVAKFNQLYADVIFEEA